MTCSVTALIAVRHNIQRQIIGVIAFILVFYIKVAILTRNRLFPRRKRTACTLRRLREFGVIFAVCKIVPQRTHSARCIYAIGFSKITKFCLFYHFNLHSAAKASAQIVMKVQTSGCFFGILYLRKRYTTKHVRRSCRRTFRKQYFNQCQNHLFKHK